jgi:surfeit locus 1 family protein
MMLFRPRLWPTLMALVMLPILVGLGTWQLHRLVWKTELLATIAARMNGEPVPLPAAIDDPQAWAFRSVGLDGRFAGDRALQLYGRTYDGKAGVHLLTPLVRDDGTAILVDRGFVPIVAGSTLAEYRRQDGPVHLEGVVRLPESPGWFMPASKPGDNIWYAVDIPAMQAATGLRLAPFYVSARPTGAAGWPAATGGTEGTGVRNEHLNYAIFWYSMAGVLIVIYVLSSRSRQQ